MHALGRHFNITIATDRHAQNTVHGFADTMRHKLNGPIGAGAKHTEQLMDADPLLAGGDQMCGQKPFMQGNMAALVNRADCGRERLTAIAAFIDAGMPTLGTIGLT